MCSGVCRIVNFPISRAVFLDRTPFVIDGDSVERERTRQEDNSGVYNGDPGFGFSRARYYVNEINSWRYILLHFVLFEKKI